MRVCWMTGRTTLRQRPSFVATISNAAHCDGYCDCDSKTIRTARSRSSGG